MLPVAVLFVIYYVLKDCFLQNFSRIEVFFQDQTKFYAINRTENLCFLFSPFLETLLLVFWYFTLLQKFFKINSFSSKIMLVSFLS